MAYEGPDRRDPERLSFPKWVTPVVTALIIGVGGVMYTSHNNIISQARDIAHHQKALQDLRDENRQLRADFERQKEKSEQFHDDLLTGVNELLVRQRGQKIQ